MKKQWIMVMMVAGALVAGANDMSLSNTAPGSYLWGNDTGTASAGMDGIGATANSRYTWGQSFTLASNSTLNSVTFKGADKWWNGITPRVLILDNPANWTAAGQHAVRYRRNQLLAELDRSYGSYGRRLRDGKREKYRRGQSGQCIGCRVFQHDGCGSWCRCQRGLFNI